MENKTTYKTRKFYKNWKTRERKRKKIISTRNDKIIEIIKKIKYKKEQKKINRISKKTIKQKQTINN